MARESFTKAGEGVQALAAGRTVTVVDHSLTVVTNRVEILSNTTPKRVMHAGWWGVIVNVATPASIYVLWWAYIQLERETYKVALNGNADGIIYHLNPGITAILTVGP